MGRDTLDAAIESVLCQSLSASEIIVVAGAPPNISSKYLSKVKLIKNFENDKGIWTAAHNRNVGVSQSNSDYIAFLDDDDLWNKNKMSIQIEFLLANPDFISISSANYKVRPWIQYKRPLKRLKDNQTVLTAIYGKKRYLPIPFYTPTPGIVVPTKIIKEIPFDESLLGFEDTWWLHMVQQKGHKIHQLRKSLITVNATPVRSISRDTLKKNVAWAKKIAEYDLSLAINYFQGVCVRNAIIGRQWHDLKFYLNPIKYDLFGREL